MSSQIHLRHCLGCRSATYFQPVKIEDAAGLMCLTCGRRMVVHYCSHGQSTLGALQTPGPELLPLLIDFGVKRAFDAYCLGCRQAISVVNAASEAVRPYSPQASSFLDQIAQAIAFGMVVITAAGVGGWLARQLK